MGRFKQSQKSSIATPGRFIRQVIPSNVCVEAITIPSPLITNYEEESIIGTGRFGMCSKVLLHGVIVCAKRLLDPACLAKSLLVHEATMLSKVRHPNIAYLLGVQTSKEPFQLLTLFYSVAGVSVTISDTLHSVNEIKGRAIELLKQTLTTNIWLGLMKDLAKALEYIHSKSIIHRDLKSDNVVFNKINETIHCVLVDFGKSNYVGKVSKYRLTSKEKETYRQDHKHIAPDLVDGVSIVSTASDMYSYGRLLKNIIQYFPLQAVATPIQKGIKKCLMYNSLERHTAVEMIQILAQ